MTWIPFDHTARPSLSLPALRAWLRERLAGMTRKPQGDAPTMHTDAEIRELHDRNRGHMPTATEAMTRFAHRSGLSVHY